MIKQNDLVNGNNFITNQQKHLERH